MAAPRSWSQNIYGPDPFLDYRSYGKDPKIIGLSNGNILIAWVEPFEYIDTDSPGYAFPGDDILGIIVDYRGFVVQDTFRINSLTSEDEEDFDIAATDDGGFVIVYSSGDRVDGNEGIYWQRHIDTGGQIYIKQVSANTSTTELVDNPQVIFNPADDSSYVVFEKTVNGDEDIRAVRLSGIGTVLTSEFDAGGNGPGFDRNPSIAINTNGELVVAYEGENGTDTAIIALVYNQSGVLQHFTTVDSAADPLARSEDPEPAVATLTNGNIVVTWADGNAPLYRVYDSNLSSLTSAQAAVITTNDMMQPSITALPDGGFVIGWQDYDTLDFEARRFNSSGGYTLADSVFKIAEAAYASDLSVSVDGRILAAYEGSNHVNLAIWDTRGSTINAVDYTGMPLNLYDTPGLVTANRYLATVLNGSTASDTLIGGLFDDTILGSRGDDYIYGGNGNDTIEGGSGTDYVLAGQGDDLIIHRDGEFIDDVYGDELVTSLITVEGVDTLDLSDVTTRGEGVTVDMAAGTWSGLGGTRIIDRIEIVQGTQLGDVFSGLDDTQFFGNGGSDTFLYRPGDGTADFHGGGGNDMVDFTAFSSFYNFYVDLAGGGYRILTKLPGEYDGLLTSVEIYRGGNGAEVVIGGATSETIETFGGNDTLDGGLGSDILIGGIGNDVYYLDNAGDVVTEFAGEGYDEVFSSVNINAKSAAWDNIERFELSGTADRLVGSTAENYLVGNALLGSILKGLTGADTLVGGAERDLMNGGGGVDQMFGNDGADLLDGKNANDFMDGGAGKDELFGRKGNDELYGGGGRDVLDGGSGEDYLSGDGGDDVLIGGAEKDVFAGGGQADTFVFGEGDLAGTTSASADRILDFSTADGDVIDLSGLDAILGGGDNAFSYVGNAAFSNTAGELRWEHKGGNTLIFMDIDGDSVADYAIRLNGEINLSEADFVL